MTAVVGLLHPGEMGAAVGAAALQAGSRVAWCSEGRSAITMARARSARLEDAGTLAALVAQSSVVVSICPPDAARQVALDVADQGFAGVFVDANAIAPETARSIDEIISARGAVFVDGGIIGGPPREGSTTRLYLSGTEAAAVAALFASTPLEAIVLSGGAGAASALKMAYAAWTKGTTALLTAIHAAALQEGVHGALLDEWQRSQPELIGRSERAMPGAARKAWRWAGEMEEIARTFKAAGLPDGFAVAATEVYRRLASFKDDPHAPGGPELARHLLPRWPTGVRGRKSADAGAHHYRGGFAAPTRRASS